jgi:hypothetical protein
MVLEHKAEAYRVPLFIDVANCEEKLPLGLFFLFKKCKESRIFVPMEHARQ